MKKKLSTKHKNRLTVTDIYNAIHNNHTYPAAMSTYLKRSRQYLASFCKKLCEQGKLEVDVKEGKGKVAIFYKIPKHDWKQNSVQDYLLEVDSTRPYFSDGGFISFGIFNYDNNFIPEKEWNWGKNHDEAVWIDDCLIKITNGRTIMFQFPKIFGPTPKLAFANMVIQAMEVKEKFLKKYPNFRFTPFPVNESLGCLGTTKLKQTINTLNPKLPIKTDSFVIDSTPEKGSFEMKIKDRPLETAEKLEKTVDTILSFPNKLDRIETILEKLVQLQVLKETTEIEKIGNILDKVPELSDLIKLLKKNNKKKKTQSYIG